MISRRLATTLVGCILFFPWVSHAQYYLYVEPQTFLFDPTPSHKSVVQVPHLPSGSEFITYKYPIPARVAVNGDRLGECLASTAAKFPHVYLSRREMIRPYRFQDFVLYLKAAWLKTPEEYLALGRFFSDSNYVPYRASTLYKTGHEEELKAWILSQPDNSLSPIEVFRASLEIHRQNIWNAVLAIHDLLRNNARYYHKSRYSYPAERRDVEALFNKLIDIRGDLKERSKSFTGDHFGSWYRIWGTMLTALAMEPEHLQTESFPMQSNSIASALKAARRLMVREELLYELQRTESATKANRPDETDTVGKIAIDQAGIRAGETLINTLWPAQLKSQMLPKAPKGCENRDYLQPSQQAAGGSPDPKRTESGSR